MKTKHRKHLWTLALVVFCAVAFGQVGQQVAKSFPSIKKLMSHDEFTKAGLSKLSDEEIKALDEWLQTYTAQVAKAVVAKSSPVASGGVAASGDVIETHIDGDFEGWDGDTVWKMDNEQIWQQSSYAYHYHYAYHPQVLIYRASAGWKMKVEGDSEEVSVKRIK